MSDGSSTASFVGSDDDARFAELYRAYCKPIQDFCRRRLVGDLVDDAVAEVFLAAWRRRDSVPAGDEALLWLYRIAYNCAIDHLRSRPQRESAKTADVLERIAPPVGGPNTEDLVFAGQIGSRVQEALNELSEQERAAFLMRHYHGCSIEEICSALDLRTNAAKHSIFRAVKKMRVALGPFVKMRAAGF